MKQPTATTLSGHLLQEAEKFLYYPKHVNRSQRKFDWQERVDKVVRKLVERRKAFAPKPEDVATQTYSDPGLVNEWYCRGLLSAVPGFVDRTLNLSYLTLAGISDSEFVYLREAANCYIFDLQEAAVALSRSALEDCLRKKLVKNFGKQVVANAKLEYLLGNLAPRVKCLSPEGLKSARKVQRAAGDVLHQPVAGPVDALPVIEAARAVILELSRR